MDNLPSPNHSEVPLHPVRQRSPLFRSVCKAQGGSAVLATEPADHQSFLHTTVLFTDVWTRISITERTFVNRATAEVLITLNKNTKILLDNQCVVRYYNHGFD